MTIVRGILLAMALALSCGIAEAGILRHIVVPIVKTAPKVVCKVVVTTYKVTKAIIY